MHDIALLKSKLPLISLLYRLGLQDHVAKSARCPLHEDKTNSFSVYDGGGEERWKCFAGCGGGDVIDFIGKYFNLDSKDAIVRYAELAGNPIYTKAAKMFEGKVAPAKVAKEGHALVAARLEPLTDKAIGKIAVWRGLAPATLKALSDAGVMGLYENKPAFKTEGGVQYRMPEDGSWRFTPGAKNTILALGTRDKKQVLFVVESNWDAIAVFESSLMPVICTRGAANARLAIDYINELSGGESMRICCFPHNDTAGIEFSNDLQQGLMLHKYVVKRIAEPHKDFAEYWKAQRGIER